MVKIDLPGANKEDVKIHLHKDRLVIETKREVLSTKKSDQFTMRERSVGSFRREIRLPTPVDPTKVKAELKGGVLTITAPKMPRSKGVPIRVF